MEFLKDLFTSASDGKLSFDEFKAACENGKIKLANLSTGDYVSKQKYSDELSVRDNRINSLEATLNDRTNDLATVKSQLESAGEDKEKLNSATNQLNELQAKYEADTKKLAQDLLNQRKTYAIKDYANSKKFTSKAARRDFENYMQGKEFSLSDNGELIGGDDFVVEYSKNNADAFVTEVKQPEQKEDEPLPKFVGSTPGSSNGAKEQFNFKFTGVRQHKGD